MTDDTTKAKDEARVTYGPVARIRCDWCSCSRDEDAHAVAHAEAEREAELQRAMAVVEQAVLAVRHPEIADVFSALVAGGFIDPETGEQR